MKDIKMIISEEDLKKNRARHIEADKRRAKAKRKELFINALGIGLFYGVIIGGLILMYIY